MLNNNLPINMVIAINISQIESALIYNILSLIHYSHSMDFNVFTNFYYYYYLPLLFCFDSMALSA